MISMRKWFNSHTKIYDDIRSVCMTRDVGWLSVAHYSSNGTLLRCLHQFSFWTVEQLTTCPIEINLKPFSNSTWKVLKYFLLELKLSDVFVTSGRRKNIGVKGCQGKNWVKSEGFWMNISNNERASKCLECWHAEMLVKRPTHFACPNARNAGTVLALKRSQVTSFSPLIVHWNLAVAQNKQDRSMLLAIGLQNQNL